MKQDPFYVKDSLSSQFDDEDKIRKQKRLDFMEQHALHIPTSLGILQTSTRVMYILFQVQFMRSY